MSEFIKLGNAGIRGVVGSGLNLRKAGNYCSALATWLDGGRVVIGCDTRQSTPMLKSIAMSTFLAAGCEVIDADITPAPLAHYLVSRLNAVGGCLIGASHHGLGWNAILPLNETGAGASPTQTQDILNILHSRQYKLAEWDKVGSVQKVDDQLTEDYIKDLLKDIDLEAIRRSRFSVVIDCCNGSASVLVDKIFAETGLNLIKINDQLRTYLPHDPEPRPRTAYQAKALLEALGADIGFVFNTDATRVSIVTSSGETLSEELTFPLVANAVLSKCDGEQMVITNTCTTRSLDDVVRQHGGELIKTRVGQAAAIEVMQDCGAILAGDGMGSVAFKGNVPAFDDFRSCLIILENMALKGQFSSALVNDIPRYHIIKSKIPCESTQAFAVLHHCSEVFADAENIDDTDGLRFDWTDGWIHLRVSETEPILRLICEWPTEEQARNTVELVKRTILRNIGR